MSVVHVVFGPIYVLNFNLLDIVIVNQKLVHIDQKACILEVVCIVEKSTSHFQMLNLL